MSRRANKYAIKGRSITLPKGCTDEDRELLNKVAFQLRGVTPEQWEQVFASPQMAGTPRAFNACMRAIDTLPVADDIKRFYRGDARAVQDI